MKNVPNAVNSRFMLKNVDYIHEISYITHGVITGRQNVVLV